MKKLFKFDYKDPWSWGVLIAFVLFLFQSLTALSTLSRTIIHVSSLALFVISILFAKGPGRRKKIILSSVSTLFLTLCILFICVVIIFGGIQVILFITTGQLLTA